MIKNHQIKRLTCYILLIFILSVLQGKAQDVGGGGGSLKFGIKGGANISSLTSNGYLVLTDVKLGYQVGVFTAYKLSSFLSVELDGLYANLGSSLIDPAKLYVPGTPGVSNITKSSVTMNTLEVPLLINIHLANIRLIIGPEMDFFLSSSALNTRMEGNNESKSRTDVTKSFQYYDFAGVAGIGFDFKGLSHTVSLEIRYRAGITRANYVRSLAFKDFNLNALSLNLGYTFN